MAILWSMLFIRGQPGHCSVCVFVARRNVLENMRKNKREVDIKEFEARGRKVDGQKKRKLLNGKATQTPVKTESSEK